ncbi:helix-turn-helix transcriptional regulator [Enterococcus sp. MJM12]|uniref:Helix-turn-helix transcriptional regulator n=1 Tax=Candidatus Enterococcus myersii TaxID=2815322 RepID=A0ABS3H5U8_9ENTE|nr:MULTISPECIES: helix-turn-helix transcriptional regulator [Enterococcus]MBO0448836.1 helix-turn-helix transcriptional regulator [Enterococcus sp. MJM12]MCD1024414.1 helix-turn-helix transcriptional regulator [Enterococcus sp. SMC-9]MDT2739910.1 helix-turn-helix transcriptional regulator [Enterococcus canintestini]WHA09190.1 helix-turn-helix transcriptional regulator [Enterococcus montenegrensis]
MNQVKIYRKNMQLSQLDLANQVGVARQTINMIENDKYNPTLDLCLRIAWALESDLNTLFWRDNDENNAG